MMRPLLSKIWDAIWCFFNPYEAQMRDFGAKIAEVEQRLTTVEAAVEDLTERFHRYE